MISVLYVDDEILLLDITKRYLEKTGEFSVETIDSAVSALSRLEISQYDAIVADYHMPVMDGLDFLREVRGRFGQVPFILFTGRGREEVVVEAINRGVDFYVQKGGSPIVQFAELALKIRQAVEKRRAENDLHAAYEHIARSEGRLRSELQFRDIFENSVAGIIQTALDGTYIRVNDTYARMFGYRDTLEFMEAESHTTRAFYANPKERENFLKILEKDGYIPPRELEVVHRDGHHFWVTFAAREATDVQGNGRYFEVTLFDITERKHASEALRKANEALAESEEKFRTIADYTYDWEYWVTPEGKIQYSSPSSRRITGYTPQELIDDPSLLEQMVLEEDLPVYRSLRKKIQSERNPVQSEYFRIRTKDGQERWIGQTANPVFDALGKYLGIRASNRDVTDRKLAENAVVDSRKILQEIINKTHTHLVYLDREFNFLAVNEAYARTCNMKPEEMVGKNHFDLYPHEENKAIFTRVRDTGNPIHFHDKAFIFPDQQDRGVTYWDWSLSAVKDRSGTVTGLVFSLVETTERKKMEDALRKANRQLNLLGSVTRHDILNKVTAIKGYLAIICKKFQDPALEPYIKKIGMNTDVIQSQIAFTKVYQDLGSQDPVWKNLDGIINNLSIPHGMTLKSEVRGVEIYADPMLEKVFFNLLDNTIRHGDHVTEMRVVLGWDEHALKIFWEDNGIGVPLEQKERIFEKGFGKNTGLGMFLVKEILALTDITIKETGEPGHGARFEITVPRGAYRLRNP